MNRVDALFLDFITLSIPVLGSYSDKLGDQNRVTAFIGSFKSKATLLCVREKLTQKTSTISWQQRGRVLNVIKTKFGLVSSPI